MKCIICRGNTREVGEKDNEMIYECHDCFLVFVDNDKLNDDLVGGENEEDRNSEQLNNGRISRLNSPNSILDFGCGHGKFVDFCKAKGIEADGVDLDTELRLEDLTKEYDAITIIEVIEHLSDPLAILGKLRDHLKPGGVIYIEGSFTDTTILYGEEDFDLLGWWYLRPSIGHITLFNQKSMEKLTEMLGLDLIEPRHNANVFRLTRKEK